MLNYKILGLSESEEWNEHLLLLPQVQQDIYFKPEYYRVYEECNYGKAICFVLIDGSKRALYPFLLNSIQDLGYSFEKEYFDIQGAYGYNGVAANSYDSNFIADFYVSFDDYVLKNNIIAEFMRYNPILSNHLFAREGQVQYNQENIIVDLSIDNIANIEYSYSTRKNLKKANRSFLNCTCVPGPNLKRSDLNKFLEIYYATMDRNKADKFYYFPDDYFVLLIKYNQNDCIFYFTYLNEIAISCELVLAGSQIAYSFLGGTLSDYFSYRPNDLLKDFIINDLKCKGYKYFCLGGGSEGVVRFKQSFSINGVKPFFIGKKIYNHTIYNNLIEQWQLKHPEKVNSLNKLLLRYHY